MQVRNVWRKKPALAYPIPPAPLTAILIKGFRQSGNIRVFEDGWTKEAAIFAPSAIAATPAQLHALPPIPSIRNALIALIRPSEPNLSEDDRERLWRAFRVPVFEQRIDESCNLLAQECEAHDGLHIESPQASPRAGEVLETGPCGCGRTTPRLISPERSLRQRPQSRGLCKIVKCLFFYNQDYRGCGETGRLPDLGSGSRKGARFKSFHPHQTLFHPNPPILLSDHVPSPTPPPLGVNHPPSNHPSFSKNPAPPIQRLNPFSH